jgi:hypothetical protein
MRTFLFEVELSHVDGSTDRNVSDEDTVSIFDLENGAVKKDTQKQQESECNHTDNAACRQIIDISSTYIYQAARDDGRTHMMYPTLLFYVCSSCK